jgi:hypothetical protein
MDKRSDLFPVLLDFLGYLAGEGFIGPDDVIVYLSEKRLREIIEDFLKVEIPR